jgi:hypothetical protein
MKVKYEFDELWEFRDRLLTVEKFDEYISEAAREITRKLHDMLIKHTPVDFGTLQAFWQTEENYAYTVERLAKGFKVTLYNRAEYATWVNDGHRQRPGRYIPGYFEGGKFRYDPNADGFIVLSKSWVEGRFFVEKSVVESEPSVEKFIEKQLNKWWKWCVNG